MILYYRNNSIQANILAQSLSLFLEEEIMPCSFACCDVERGSDLVLIDGRDIHHQRLKKIIRYHENSFVVLISDKQFQGVDVAALVPCDSSAHHIAGICRLLLGRQKVERHLGLNVDEEILLKNLGRGASNKEIARDYNWSLSMVKYHLQNIYTKMGVNNRTQAALKARETIL